MKKELLYFAAGSIVTAIILLSLSLNIYNFQLVRNQMNKFDFNAKITNFQLANKLSKLSPKSIKVYGASDKKIVVEGEKYNSDLLLTFIGNKLKPEFEVLSNEGDIRNVEGVGKFETVASTTGGIEVSEGLFEKKWVGKVSVQLSKGRTKEFIDTVIYYVVKPKVNISMQQVSSFYKGCGNPINISCPALAAAFNPTYKITGGTFIEGKQLGDLIIYPESKTVSLTIFSNGIELSTQKFRAKPIPLPQIEVLPDGRRMSSKSDKNGVFPPRTIQIKAIADQSFKFSLPNEAKYRVTKWSVYLAKDKAPISQLTFNNSRGNVASLTAKIDGPGYRMIIEVQEVKRVSSKGQIEKIKIPPTIRTLSF